MKKIILIIGLVSVLFMLSGCTSKVAKVDSLDTNVHHIDEICIEKNHKVIVKDFLPFIISEFKKHNIKSKVYNEKVPNSCLYDLQYSANHHWDIVMYFRIASLNIYNKNILIASALYETQNGLDMSKFNSMETKFTPIMDELLKGHAPPTKEELLSRKSKEIKKDNIVTKRVEISLEDKLLQIKKMKDDGLISDDEYASKRQQLLNDY